MVFANVGTSIVLHFTHKQDHTMDSRINEQVLIVTNLCDESAQGGFIPRAVIIYECSSPLKSPLKCRQTVLCPHSSGHRDESGHETSCGHFNEGEHS